MMRSLSVRPAAVAGAFYPADRVVLKKMIGRQLDYGRELVGRLDDALPQGAPKAVIVPHAGYVYSGTTAALAYALLERGRGTIRRAVIVGPTHRVPVRGVACPTAGAFATPLGTVPVDVPSERHALGLPDGAPLRSGMRARPDAPAPALIVNDPTHAQEHAVEVQIPFLQTVLGPDLEIVPLNAGDASPREVGDVLRSLWGGPETVIVISSDLSHYHPQEYARELDDETIDAISRLDGPIHPRRACGAYPINGLLDVLTYGLRPTSDGYGDGSRTTRASGSGFVPVDGAMPTSSVRAGTESAAVDDHDVAFDLRLLGRSTSGDDGVVALAGKSRPRMTDPDEAVVGYSSFAIWQTPVPSDAGHAEPNRSAVGHDAEEETDTRNRGESAGTSPRAETGRNGADGNRGTGTADHDTAVSDGMGGAADTTDTGKATDTVDPSESAPDADESRGDVLLRLARAAIREHLELDDDPANRPNAIIERHPWLYESGASFVTLTEHGRLRGCIGTLQAYRPLGCDVAAHAVDAAAHDPRFAPVTPREYPLLDVEVSVLGKPEPVTAGVADRDANTATGGGDTAGVGAVGASDHRGDGPEHAHTRVDGTARAVRPVRSRTELERALSPGEDGLILTERGGRGRRATFLPQVWEQLPDPHDFVSHLLAKAGIAPDLDWSDGEIECERYGVTAYAERE